MKKGDEILVRIDVDFITPARVTRISGNNLYYRFVPNEMNWAQHGSERVLVSDRGVTWAPAWRADEAAAFRAACAL